MLIERHGNKSLQNILWRPVIFVDLTRLKRLIGRSEKEIHLNAISFVDLCAGKSMGNDD
jgi:hypothetical protein